MTDKKHRVYRELCRQFALFYLLQNDWGESKSKKSKTEWKNLAFDK